MDDPRTTTRQRLLAALGESDELRRIGRAERIEWLALHEISPPVLMGRVETMQLLREAREVFVDGHFAAALLVALSFIEHTLVEELQLLGHVKGSPKFSQAIIVAEEKNVFPADWLARAKKLSLRRNPFAHLKDAENEHTLGERIRNEQRHPIAILESDAKDSIDLMYSFFTATLREHAELII
jgi:hypothetical protein